MSEAAESEGVERGARGLCMYVCVCRVVARPVCVSGSRSQALRVFTDKLTLRKSLCYNMGHVVGQETH